MSSANAATEWEKGTGEDVILGTENASDIDTISFQNIVDPLDRLLARYREGCKLVYASVATITVNLGEVVCTNTAGTIRKFRRNTSNTTVAWTDIDTGSEAISTTYYIYAVADADATTFTCKVTTSSSAPSGVTYYKRLGSFYNDSDSNITKIANDNTQTDWGIYDSGYFAVAANTTYTKTHSLGTTKVLTLIYFSVNSDGSGECGIPTHNYYYEPYNSEAVTYVTALSTTAISIKTGPSYVANVAGTNRTSGYERIIMVALE